MSKQYKLMPMEDNYPHITERDLMEKIDNIISTIKFYNKLRDSGIVHPKPLTISATPIQDKSKNMKEILKIFNM